MPTFTNEPPDMPNGYVFRIVRTPANSVLQAAITCDDAVGCETHFANNRTVPCEGPDACDLCTEGYSRRWHGYVSAVLHPSLEHVLFEFTAQASDTFKNYRLLHNTLRACLFKASRPSKRPNGRVIIHTSPGDEQRIRIPPPPDIRKILCHIWNVPYNPHQPTRMNRPPFKSIHLTPANGDGRYTTHNPPPT